jgi:hypothetical protein
MPVRDLFHAAWADEDLWEGFHSAWANTLVRHLNSALLPPHYRAVPQIHLGTFVETDVSVEVKVFDEESGRRLVGVIELVSPRNKDRPEARKVFVGKCAAYLQKGIGLIIADVVTNRRANLHHELLEMLSQSGPAATADLYAVTYQVAQDQEHWRVHIWPCPLTIGSDLPMLPLWLAPDFAVPIDLEKSYEETCQVLRME